VAFGLALLGGRSVENTNVSGVVYAFIGAASGLLLLAAASGLAGGPASPGA
jgi:hypothetical protein